MLTIHTLGGLSLSFAEAHLPLPPTQTSRSLLVYLLLHADRPQARAHLVGLFWPDLPEQTARRRVSNALWEIRSALSGLGGLPCSWPPPGRSASTPTAPTGSMWLTSKAY